MKKILMIVLLTVFFLPACSVQEDEIPDLAQPQLIEDIDAPASASETDEDDEDVPLPPVPPAGQ